MNLKTVKYKAIVFGLISVLLLSGCKDFLQRDIEDQQSTESVKTFDQYLTLTSTLYGGHVWLGYQGKFAWMVNEGLAGNLWNAWLEEGALFLGDVSPTNGHIRSSYTDTYSGIISDANYIINRDKPTLTPEEANRINAEAKVFRALAYFLVTEYFGEVPLVLNNEKIIRENLVLPKATRGTIYKAIELDLLFAAEWLPADRKWREGRVTCWSAKALLMKLYLTMASCQTPLTGPNDCPYLCPDPQGYYQKVIDLGNEIIAGSGASLTAYKDVFALTNPKGYIHNDEVLLAIHFVDLGWGAGSHWQSMLSYEPKFWGPGTGWGGWKSLTQTLFEAYHPGDLRKREVCIYTPTTETSEIWKDWPGYTPKAYGEKWSNWKGDPPPYAFNQKTPDGDGQLAGARIRNNIKKYVYGYDSSAEDNMSCPMRMDFVRLGDVYMMLAEAKMGKATGNGPAGAMQHTSAGMEDLIAVVSAHGGPDALDALNKQLAENNGMAHYTEAKFNRILRYEFLGAYDDENADKQYAKPGEFWVEMEVPELRTDFIQERRKEFAMEGQSWWDVKRLFYRCPECAKKFFKEQDRGWDYTQKWNETGDPDLPEREEKGLTPNHENGFARTALYQKMSKKYPKLYLGDDFEEAAISDAITKGTFDRWFFPLPSNIVTQLQPGDAQDFTDQLDPDNYTYPY